MALQVKAISIVQGSTALKIKAVSLDLFGLTPNNTPPLITPVIAGGGAIIGSNIIVKPVKKPA